MIRFAMMPVIAAISMPCTPSATEAAPAPPMQSEPSAAIAPVLFAPEALGQEGRITFSPGFSPDGARLYFTRANCQRIWNCPQLLFRSQLVDGRWSAAEPVNLPQTARAEWPSFTPDGRRLLFSWAPIRARHEGQDVIEDFDLFSLDLTANDAQPEALDNPDINRIRGGRVATLRFVNNETAPVLTRSGDLYFWSERLDGVGGRDIYVARSDGQGGFRPPAPLPAPINSAQDNAGSWVSADGRILLSSQAGRGGEGGSDLFVSVLGEDGWSVPENLGPRVNTSDSEFAGRITPDGKQLVFTSDRSRAEGKPSGLFQVWTIPTQAVPALRKALAGN